jgi:importin subunit alpha-1
MDNHVAVIVTSGAIQKILPMITQKTLAENSREMAVWTIGNVAGDGLAAQKYLIQLGAIKPLLHVLESGDSILVMRKAVFALANICGRETCLDDVV